MNYRFMRIVVMFDLPVLTLEDKRNYRNFRKTLIKNGFVMIQESVYCRMLLTPTMKYSVMDMLKKNKPPKGIVQAMMITEKQFEQMEYIVGENESDVIDTDKRLVII